MMQAIKALKLLILVFSFSVSVSYANQCSRFCKEHHNIYGYEVGKVYSYNYSGNVKSFINSTRNSDESGVIFESIVDIKVLSACDFVLSLKNANIENYYIKNNIVSKQPLTTSHDFEKYPLHFSFNGKIETICPNENERKDVLNVKRAVLSVFQNSVQSLEKTTSLLYETDINGNCETLYEILDNMVVKKSKNLNACSHRTSQYLTLSNNFNSKSLPLLRSNLNCLQRYNNDYILQSSACTEKHIFQPFSNGDNGALTLSNQEMKLFQIYDDDSKDIYKIPVRKSNLIFEIDDGFQDAMQNVEPLLETLKKLNLDSDGLDDEIPMVFSHLKHQLQHFNKTNLMSIYEKLTDKQRKFYIDALSSIKTEQAIDTMIDLFLNNKIDLVQVNFWIISLNFIKNPSLEIIKSLMPIIELPAIKQNSHLAISNILHEYCKIDTYCLDKYEVNEIINLLTESLQSCIPKSPQDHDNILLSLKAIGNAGLPIALNKLKRCYSNKQTPIELRLAAFNAHRRIKCNLNSNSHDMRNYISDVNENVEVRIAAYLTSMQCASYNLLNHVNEVLVKEEMNQVGSFIWTHLSNLQKTSVHWKQGIRSLLDSEYLKNKFNTDVRKYSRNYEISKYFELLGVGGSAESNVIFTPESYLPKSGMLNLTIDLFGETINLLEIGGRVEGFEGIFERFFGNKSTPIGDLNNERLKQINEQFKTIKQLEKHPSGLLYSKLFGNEFSYKKFSNLEELFGNYLIQPSIDSLLQYFKYKENEYKKSMMFLDSSIQLPTLLGFPLKLSANGTMVFGLKTEAELNLSRDFLIKGKLYPSVYMEITGSMILNTFNGNAGIKYVGRMNSNSYIDGHLKANMGKIIDLKINLPKEKMDVINLSSTIFIINNDNSYKIDDDYDLLETSEACSPKIISHITGLKVCHNLRYINASLINAAPYFPLTGNFKYALNVHKTDTFDSYQFLVKNQQIANYYAADLMFNTPNSKVNREINASFVLDLDALELKANLKSPFVSFAVNSHVVKKANQYQFEIKSSFNNREMIMMKALFNVENTGNVIKYEPFAVLNFKEKQIASLNGSLIHIRGEKYVADLTLEGFSYDMINFYGDLINLQNQIILNANFQSEKLNGRLNTELGINDNSILWTTNTNYNTEGNPEENVKTVFEVRKLRGLYINEDLLSLSIKTSKYDNELYLHNQRSLNYFNNTGRLKLLETSWLTNQLLKADLDDHSAFKLYADLRSPENSIDYRFDLSYNKLKDALNAHGLVQINKRYRLESALNLNYNKTNYGLFASVYYPEKTWTLRGDLTTVDTISEFNMLCQQEASNFTKVYLKVTGSYLNSSINSNDLQNHELNCNFDMPQFYHDSINVKMKLVKTISQNSISCLYFLTTDKIKQMAFLNWSAQSFKLGVQNNNAALILIQSDVTPEEFSASISINIYQHFLLNVNLNYLTQRVFCQFFWDKSNDSDKNFLFLIESNNLQGNFKAALEYPGQKINASLILLYKYFVGVQEKPTQVVLNVTWGTETSNKIYLKVGNKIYDSGGTWFGELQTPFNFLEKQNFHINYVVSSEKFLVQSDISWRYHNINLSVVGVKLPEKIGGEINFNSTIEEIAKFEVALYHTKESFKDYYKTKANFVYNDHEISAITNWKLIGFNVDAHLQIESSSNLIQPIIGKFINRAGSLEIYLQYQSKVIRGNYEYTKEQSKIFIETPFEGFQKTILQYSIISDSQSVLVKANVDIFNHNNEIKLHWQNFNNYTAFLFDLTSPITGAYFINFTHSSVFGILKEILVINGPENKNLLTFNVQGEIIPDSFKNINALLKILNHHAELDIKNKSRAFVDYELIANWDNYTISSVLFANVSSSLKNVTWKLSSNLFVDELLFKYESNDAACLAKLQLSDVIVITNNFAWNYDNHFMLRTKNSAITYTQINNSTLLLTEFDANFDQFYILKSKLSFEKANNYVKYDLISDQFKLNVRGVVTYQKGVLKIGFNKFHKSPPNFTCSYKFGDTIQIKIISDKTTYELNGSFHHDSSQLRLNLELDADNDPVLNIKTELKELTALSIEVTAHYSTDIYSNMYHFDLNYDHLSEIKIDFYTNNVRWFSKLSYDLSEIQVEAAGFPNQGNSLVVNFDFNNKKFVSIYKDDLLNKNYLHFDLRYNNIDNDYELSIESLNNILKGTLNFKKIINLHVQSNMDLLNELVVEITNDDKYVEGTLIYKQKDKEYHLNLSSIVSNDVIELQLTANGFVPCNITLEIDILRKDFVYTTQANLIVGDDKYTADIITNHIDWSDTTLNCELRMPRDGLISGVITTKISDSAKNVIVRVSSMVINLDFNLTSTPDHFYLKARKDKYDFLLNYYLNKNEISAVYKLDDETKYSLEGNINNDVVNLSVNKPDSVNYILINGKHKLNGINDFSFNYIIVKESKKIKVDVINYFGDYYQTKIDVYTPFRGWARLFLESTVEKDMTRISFNARNHYMSLIARQYNPKGGDILLIDFQGETLLQITASSEQMTLHTSSRFGVYRLFIQGNLNPGIYVFTILKDGENLISLMLQNYSTQDYTYYKGKLVASNVLPYIKSFEFSLNYQPLNYLHFLIADSNNKLMDLSCMYKNSEYLYSGEIKFESALNIKDIKNIQVNVNLNFEDNFDLTSFLILNDKRYETTIINQPNHRKVLFLYPCEEFDSCKFEFVTKETLMHFNWTSPLENYKIITLLSELKYDKDSLNFDHVLSTNNNTFDMKLRLALHNSIIAINCEDLFNIIIHYNYIQEKQLIIYAAINEFDFVKYEYYNELTRTHKVSAQWFNVYAELIGNFSEEINIIALHDEKYSSMKIKNINGNKNSIQVDINSRLFNATVFYNFLENSRSAGLNYKHDLPLFALKISELNCSLNMDKDFSKGYYHMFAIKDESVYNKTFIWESNETFPQIDFSINYSNGNETNKMYLNHIMSNNSVNVLIHIGEFNLSVKGVLLSNQVKGDVALTSPLPIINLKSHIELLHENNENLKLYYSIDLPERDNMLLDVSVKLQPHRKCFLFYFDSTFYQKINTTVVLETENQSNIKLLFESGVGLQFIRLTSFLKNNNEFEGYLSSSFNGFKNISLKSHLNNENKVLKMIFIKDRFKFDMIGELINDQNDYEMNLIINYPDGFKDTARALIKLREMYLNASFSLVSGDIVMNIDLDNNMYNINFQSPYKYAKNVNLKGIYSSDINNYSITSNGNWNNFIIEFTGSILNKNNLTKLLFGGHIGNDINCEMNLTHYQQDDRNIFELVGFYPEKTSYTYMKYESSLDNITIMLKTPFKVLSTFNVKTYYKLYEKLNVSVAGCVAETCFNTQLVKTLEDSKLNLAIPDLKKKFCVNLHTGEKEALLNILHESINTWNNITFGYIVETSQFSGNFIMYSNRFNSSHFFKVLYEDTPDKEYGIILDDYKMIGTIITDNNQIKTSLFAKIPYLDIKEVGIYAAKDLLNHKYQTKLVYNQFYIQGNFSIQANKSIQVQCIVPSDSMELTVTVDLFTDGLHCNVTLDYAVVHAHFIFDYQNNDTIIHIYAHDAEDTAYIRIKKNLDAIELSLPFQGTSFNYTTNHLQTNKMLNMQWRGNYMSLLFDNDANIKRINLAFYPLNIEHLEAISTSNKFSLVINNDLDIEIEFSDSKMGRKQYSLTINVYNDNSTILTFDTMLNYEKSINMSFDIKAYERKHSAKLFLDTNNRFLLKIDATSPVLFDRIINIDVNVMSLQNMSFYLSSGDDYLLMKSLIANHTMQLLYHSPICQQIKLFQLELIWDVINKTLSQNKLEIESDFYGNIFAQANFLLMNDLLDIETNLLVPFLEGFEIFKTKIYIPKEFRPNIYVEFPNNVTYSLYFDHQYTNDVIYLRSGYTCNGQRNHIDLFTNYKTFNASFDNYWIKFYYDYIYLNDHKLLKLAYDDYRLNQEHLIHFEIKNRHPDKALTIYLFYPGWTNKIGTNFLFTHESLSSFHLTYDLMLPSTTICNLQHVEFELSSDFNNSNVVTFIGGVKSRQANYALMLKILNDLNEKVFIVDVNNNNRDKMLVQFNLSAYSPFNFALLTQVKTPFELFEDVNVVVSSSFNKNNKTALQASMRYNNNDIIDNQFLLDQNAILIYSDMYLLLFDFKMNATNTLDTNMIFCWDKSRKSESQIGGKFYYNNDLIVHVYYPKHTFEYEAISNESHYYWKAAWNDHIFAIKNYHKYIRNGINIHYESDSYIQHPLGKFQIIQNSDVVLNKFINMNSSTEIIWYYKRRTSKLIFNNKVAQGNLISKITIPDVLNHDIILNIDLSNFYKIPSTFKTSLKYSNDLDRLLQIEMYFNEIIKNDNIYTERNFILKHLASKIDYEMYFNALKNNERCNSSVVLKYKNFNLNSTESIKASVRVDLNKFLIAGDVFTPQNSLNIKAASISQFDQQGFCFRVQINDKDPLNLEALYYSKPITSSITLTAAYGDNRKYRFYAGLPNEREITTKLEYDLFGKTTIENLFTLRLNNSQLLWLKILWKNNLNKLYEPFYNTIIDDYNDIRYVIDATGHYLINVMHDDVGKELVNDVKAARDKGYSTMMDFLQYLAEITTDLLEWDKDVFDKRTAQILSALKEQLLVHYKKMEELGRKLYAHIYQTYKEVVDEQIREAIKKLDDIKNWKIDAKAILKRSIEETRKCLHEMEQITIRLLDDLQNYINYLKDKVVIFFEPFLNLLDDIIAYIEQRLAILQIIILDTVDALQHYVYNLKEIKELLGIYSSYIKWLDKFYLSNLLEPICDIIEEIVETIMKDFKQAFEHYQPYFATINDAIFGKYDGINDLPEIVELRDLLNHIYQKTIWIWNYNNVTERIKSYVYTLSAEIDDVLLLIDFDERNQHTIMEITTYTFIPEKGELEINQPLPIKWEAFNKPPLYEEHPLYHRIQNKIQQFARYYKQTSNFYESIDYLSSLFQFKISPSTYNIAMIIGHTNFITFNNRHYSLGSNCSYMLAGDFQTFSILINQKSNSFEILTNSTLELFSNYTVTLNKKNVELPLIYEHIIVLREHDNVVTESTQGFKMICNFNYHFCTIELSGWLFGKTGGLLGTLDNEQKTDIMSSNGRLTSSLFDFASSWKMNEECIQEERNSNNKHIRYSLLNSLCMLLFQDDNSPFYECFDAVNATPFIEICLNANDLKTKLSVCSVAAAYRTRCLKANKLINMPDICVQCDGIGDTERIYDGHNPKSLDIVFITQLNCRKEPTDIILPKLLNDKLESIGYTLNRFAAVGYGDDIIRKPHIYTMNEQIFTNSSEHFKLRYYYYNDSGSNLQKYTAVDAINYATNLRFRVGVSKLFILTQCDTVRELENSPRIYNMLGEKDITLHLIKPNPFDNDIIGIEEGNLALVKNSSLKLSIDAVINNIDDLYSGLALSTNGTVFNLNKILTYRDDALIWSEFVSKTVKESPCQKCKCVQDNDSGSKTECSRCLAPAIKQFLNEYEASNMMQIS